MAGKLNINAIPNPELTDALLQLKQDIFRTLHCVKVGQIQSFDATKKTAQVQILFKRVLNDGTIADYPILADCPIFTLQGGGGAIQFPIQAGDQCLLFFSDRNIDAWFQSGGSSAPFDARCHDLSDGFALVGINALSSSLPAYAAGQTTLAYNGAKIILQGGLLSLANGTTSLLTLLQNLATILEGATIDTTHGVFSGTTITAITDWALSLAGLLQ